MPRVRIVADYCARGYQLRDDAARAVGLLPISDALSARLTAWNDRYEACDPTAYDDICGARFDFVAFAKEGLDIARAIKRELPDWTVTYWDESLDWFLARDPRSYSPERAEYEIPLADAAAGSPG